MPRSMLPARTADRRPGDRRRARARTLHRLPLVRIPRGPDRRGDRPRGGLLAAARGGASGRGGPALLDIFDRLNRSLADAPALRQFVEQERETALRIITSSGGGAQPHNVARIVDVIDDEVRAGRYDPPVDPATLGYAIVRLAEAFLFNDAAHGSGATSIASGTSRPRFSTSRSGAQVGEHRTSHLLRLASTRKQERCQRAG